MRACDGAVYVQSSRVLGVADTHDEGMADRVDSFLRDDTAMIPVGERGCKGVGTRTKALLRIPLLAIEKVLMILSFDETSSPVLRT